MQNSKISEMASRRAKRSEIWDPGVVLGIYVQLLELWPIAKFHAQIWQQLLEIGPYIIVQSCTNLPEQRTCTATFFGYLAAPQHVCPKYVSRWSRFFLSICENPNIIVVFFQELWYMVNHACKYTCVESDHGHWVLYLACKLLILWFALKLWNYTSSSWYLIHVRWRRKEIMQNGCLNLKTIELIELHNVYRN